jgi:hypothetical protein
MKIHIDGARILATCALCRSEMQILTIHVVPAFMLPAAADFDSLPGAWVCPACSHSTIRDHDNSNEKDAATTRQGETVEPFGV